MLTLCWSAKGGSGTTVVAAGIALTQRRFRYATFKSLVAAPVQATLTRELIREHPMIRPMEQYALAGFTASALPESYTGSGVNS